METKTQQEVTEEGRKIKEQIQQASQAALEKARSQVFDFHWTYAEVRRTEVLSST